MKRIWKRTFALLLAVLLLIGVTPTVLASDSSTDPEGGSFEEAYSLQLTGSDLKANYSGEFAEGDSTDYFKIQAPNHDCTMCFSLQLDTSILLIGDSTWHDGRTVKAYVICVYDSEFHQIGYAYEGISYTWIEKLPGTSLYHTVQDDSIAVIAVPVERNKTYFIKAIRTDYYIYPTAFRYSLDVFSGPKMVMDSLPFQTTYLVGDKLNLSGLSLSLHYPDGVVENLSSGYDTYSAFGTEKAGRQTINISYVHKIENSVLTYKLCESFFIDVLETKTTCGKCGDNLNWTLDTSSGSLFISGTGAMTDFRSSYSVPWYFDLPSIQTVIIDSGVTSIGNYAFNTCINLSGVVIPDSVTRIGNNAFADCSLADITIPDSVTGIGDHAFMFCGAFTDLTIPDGVTYIGDGAFSFCGTLTSVTIPGSVIYIGQGAFQPCPCLATITVDERNANYSSDEYGVLYNKDKTVLIKYPSGNTSVEFTVPDGVTRIDDDAFCYTDSLESVAIPNSVTYIGSGVFASCWCLSSIHIPSGVTSIGEDAFSYCDKLEYICSDTKNCYAKTYAEENGIAFRLCDGHGLSCEHEYTSAVTTEPTCTAAGVRTYTCTLCGNSYTETVPALGHDYDAVVTEPTCTAGGYTTYTCTRCGSSYTANATDALGHRYSSAVTKAATCKAEGVRTYTCSVCGSSYTEAIAKTAHTPQTVTEPASCQATGRQYTKCAVCGDTLSEVTVLPKTDHTYTSAVTKAATCKAEGVRTYTCSVCGNSYTEAIAKTAHTPQTVTEPATCQATGKQYTKCSVCGDTLSEVTVLPKTDHTPAAAVKENETAATCTAAGKYDEVVRCSVCSAVLSCRTVDTPALGHSFTKYVYNNDATTEQDGTKTAKCDRCSVTDTIPAPGTKLQPPTVAIKNYTANKTVDYRATVTFTVEVKNPADSAKVHWFLDGKDAGTGETYTAKEVKETFTVQAKYMQGGKVLAVSEPETVKVNSGFGARLKAFFRALFGRLPKVVQEYLGVEFIDRVQP